MKSVLDELIPICWCIVDQTVPPRVGGNLTVMWKYMLKQVMSELLVLVVHEHFTCNDVMMKQYGIKLNDMG